MRPPTIAGLRIGKPQLERQTNEPLLQALEWDRDGQYFHYLTKWMHALYCVSRLTGINSYHQWAIELAKTAHAAFTSAPLINGKKRIFWKMSTDLKRPLVAKMGQHDALDGLITYLQLQTFNKHLIDIPAKLSLTRGSNGILNFFHKK